MMLPADEKLMLEVRNGDVRKLGVLFERYQGALFNYFLRLSGNRAGSEDMVQDVFLRILRYRHTYREGTPFQTWMYHIARNARIDWIRKIGAERALDENHDGGPDHAASPVDTVAAKQDADLVRRALAAMAEDKREVLVLSRYQNLKYEEIARLLDCEAGTIKVRVYRAIRELRQIYSELTGRKV